MTRPLRGSWQVAGPLGIPMLLNWSIPLGVIPMAMFVGFSIIPLLYCVVGYVLLILVHELGHAVAAKLVGLKVFAIEVSALGGLCWFQRTPVTAKALFVASGGVLAQIVLFVCVLPVAMSRSLDPSHFVNCLLLVFTVYNLLMLLLNLIPIKDRRGIATDGRLIIQILRGHFADAS